MAASLLSLGPLFSPRGESTRWGESHLEGLPE